ncbi:hypothetical protein [Eubacterium xylanophilum]|uniref:hypothetical protein n=1 Tax=Eubacterium xylanophilum TaxID=39497 RepID=UPI00047E5F45|nr:hypothetical protein [Eubacterium xylanophilum]
MFILCKGSRAKKPYIVPISEEKIYSIEEMCYYIYNNIYKITEEFFTDDLPAWIRDELHMLYLAKKMKQLIDEKHDIKDLVVTIMCACDYYREEEIVKLVTVMEKIAHLPSYKRNKMKADQYLSAGKYSISLLEYRSILNHPSVKMFSDEERGALLHNQAVALLHVSSFEEAEKSFEEAYIMNKREETKLQYLFMLLFENKQREFEEKAVSMGVTPEQIIKIKSTYDKIEGECVVEDRDPAFITECIAKLRD